MAQALSDKGELEAAGRRVSEKASRTTSER
jgi:hypothetical protein